MFIASYKTIKTKLNPETWHGEKWIEMEKLEEGSKILNNKIENVFDLDFGRVKIVLEV